MPGSEHDNQTAVAVNVQTLKYIATKSMPSTATDLQNQAQSMLGLLASSSNEWGPGPNPAFGSEVPGATSLGSQYNAVVNAINALATQFGTSIQNGANSLNTIADNYHKTDTSIAGN